METNDFSPQQSLELITAVIQEARSKFEEDGVIYTMWGALLLIASLGQFYLLSNAYYQTHYYPYFLMPVGGLVTWWYYYRKVKTERGSNQIGKINTALWITCGINMFLLGFMLNYILQANLTPVILIVLGIGITVSGTIIQSKILQFSGIFTNVAAVVCFYIAWHYHPLVNATVALFAVLIPGILLMNRYKKQHV